MAGLCLRDQSWALGKGTNNDAELFALGAAAESIWIARKLGLAPTDRAFVLTDSDTNLSRLSKSASSKDSPLLKKVRAAISRCRAQAPLSLVWVPGHCGVEGNERADKCAGDGSVDSMRLGMAEPQGSKYLCVFLTDAHVEDIFRACGKDFPPDEKDGHAKPGAILTGCCASLERAGPLPQAVGVL